MGKKGKIILNDPKIIMGEERSQIICTYFLGELQAPTNKKK